MWGVVAWEKQPGGRDTNNPDVSKKSRPTIGMPILIDMKKKPGADPWEGQVYNAKDGQIYSSSITPTDADQLEIKGCVLGFLCGGETWTRVGPPIPSSPANSMAKGAAKSASAPKDCDGSGSDRARRHAEEHALGQAGRPEDARPSADHGRRHLPTRRYRAVCPLARAGTAARRRASSPARAPAACPCSTCRDGWTATGCRTRSPSSAR